MHCDMTRSTKNQPHTYKISTFASHLGGGQKKILNPLNFELFQMNVMESAMKRHTLLFCSTALFFAIHNGFRPTLINIKHVAGHKNSN